MQQDSPIVIPETYNYIGVFLTFACNLKCSYCINHEHILNPKYIHIAPKQWIQGLNRIHTRPDLPITLQGGEPLLYHGVYEVINGIRPDINIDILTNGTGLEELVKHVPPQRLKRQAKYASIRVSYHVEQMELEDTIKKVKHIQDKGYSIGVWIVDHPKYQALIKAIQNIFISEGIDCRLKEFLGVYNNKMYGTYRYPQNGKKQHKLCKPSEMLIAPNGDIHRCHYELYSMSLPYTNLMNKDVELRTSFYPCNTYGMCNSCDVKLKTNRFQEYGHSSVEVKDAILQKL